MIKKASYVGIICLCIAVLGVVSLRQHFTVGPIVLILAVIPVLALVISRRSLKRAIPDLIFGAIDTGMLTIPALWGGTMFGVAGAIAGGVIGDALTDGIAGFFEGGIAQWLSRRGIETSREPITTALGKMTGCLVGSGLVLTFALMLGVRLDFS